MKSHRMMGYCGLMIAVFSFVCCDLATGQPPGRRSKKSNGPGLKKGITWYGVLEDGLAVAKATEKPIMLLSAAPQCAGIPGMW